jgi:hypothetical protein
MKAKKKILRALGRIEGELVDIRKQSHRISSLEHWQYWIKGGLAILAVACAYILNVK